jgi:hypothetical protein
MNKDLLLIVFAMVASTGHAELRLSVAVNNRAEIGRRMLASAEETAGLVFQHAGVGVIWLDCTNSEGPDAEIRLNLVNGTASAMGGRDTALGYAVMPDDDSAGRLIYIFRSELDRLRQELRFIALGHAIAHEIGHLLLGSEHTSFGVMSTAWHAEEISAASIGTMGFSKEQRERIRAAVALRAAVRQ